MYANFRKNQTKTVREVAILRSLTTSIHPSIHPSPIL